MGRACVWKPGINKDMSGEPSALYSEILDYTGGNREVSNVLYAATKVDGGLGNFTDHPEDIEYNEQGEPTLESLNKILPIKDFVAKTSLSLEKKEAGAVDESGKTIVYDTYDEAVRQCERYNSSQEGATATPASYENGYQIVVARRTVSNRKAAEEASFQNDLCKNLLARLRSLGFTAINDDSVEGIFDPTNAVEMSNGLKAVIRIAKGQVGEEAFPEEFAHLMIEGLKGHSLVVRLLDTLGNLETIQRILGDSFEAYYNKYNGDIHLLAKEAAGKMLADAIKGTVTYETTPMQTTLLGRLWNFIKNLFSKGSVSDVDKDIKEARQIASELSDGIIDESALDMFDGEQVMNGDALFKLASEISEEEQILKEALDIATRRAQIDRSRTKSRFINRNDVNLIRSMRSDLESLHFKEGIINFLSDLVRADNPQDLASQDLSKLHGKLPALAREVEYSKEKSESSDLGILREAAISVRKIKEFSMGYTPILDKLLILPQLVDSGEVPSLTREEALRISNMAHIALVQIKSLMKAYDKLRFKVVYMALMNYWGEDKKWTVGSAKKGYKGNLVTLELLLRETSKDITIADRYIGSLAEASDPVLALVDVMVKTARARRDNHLEVARADIIKAHMEYKHATGTDDTSWMNERDAKGKPTGRIISKYDWEKYEQELSKEKDKLKKLLKEGRLTKAAYYKSLDKWVNDHLKYEFEGSTEQVPIYEDEEKFRKIVPKGSAKEKYYNEMIALKRALEQYYPANVASLYNSIQIRNDAFEIIKNNKSNPKKLVKNLIKDTADKFTRRSDDTEFGAIPLAEGDELEEMTGNVKYVSLDFVKEPYNRLPIYYVKPLEDPERLNMDFTGCMMAYAASSIDWQEMNKIVDILELTRDLLHDRQITQYSGKNKLIEKMRVLKRDIITAYKKKGGAAAERMDQYMDMVVYSKYKKDEGTVTIKGIRRRKGTDSLPDDTENSKYEPVDIEVDVAKTLDLLKQYTGIVGLGLNMFSGMSNVAMGKMQMFLEAVAKEHFGFKESAASIRNYWGLLPKYLGELNTPLKTSKMSLLINKYDALQEFWESLRMQGLFTGPIGYILRGQSLLILNNMGEHYLHARTMFAFLNKYKVEINGSTLPLLNAWYVHETKDDTGKTVMAELYLKDGTTYKGQPLFTKKLSDERDKLIEERRKYAEEGKMLPEDKDKRLQELEAIKDRTDDLNIQIRLEINSVNSSMHGAFNMNDRGTINRYAIGRLAMQFRQWMPAHFARRFATPYYDARLRKFREGFYRTYGRFLWDCMGEFLKGKFSYGMVKNNLTAEERANVRRAWRELLAFAVLSILCNMTAGWKDKEGNLGERLLYYNLLRLRLEVGASAATPEIITNSLQILQSPMASLKTIEKNLIGMISVWHMWDELETGSFAGHSKWYRDFIVSAPLYGQIRKFMDLSGENYMFEAISPKY